MGNTCSGRTAKIHNVEFIDDVFTSKKNTRKLKDFRSAENRPGNQIQIGIPNENGDSIKLIIGSKNINAYNNNTLVNQIKAKSVNQLVKLVDSEFTTSPSSLGESINSALIEWHRCSDIMHNDPILFKDISPFQPRQGEIGDSYFISALSALAKYPNLIQNIFKEKEVNSQGLYHIRIYLNGVVVSMAIDDYIPCKIGSKKPKFAQPYENQIWPMLLEKTWAKVYCSYSNIVGNDPGEPIRMFVGAPYKGEKHSAYSANQISLWYKIIASIDCGRLVISFGSKRTYCVIATKLINVGNKDVKLLTLRDPYGFNDWNGNWSNYDKVNWTKEAKEQMGITEFSKGLFHMCFEDYLTQYYATTFSQVHSNYMPHFAQFGHKIGGYSVCKLKFDKPTNGYIYATYLDYKVRDSNIKQFDDFILYGGIWKITGVEYEFITSIQVKAPCISILDDWELNGDYMLLVECTSTGPENTNQIIICAYTEFEPKIYEIPAPLPNHEMKKLMRAVSLSSVVKQNLIEEDNSIATYTNFMKGGISMCSYMIRNQSKDESIKMNVQLNEEVKMLETDEVKNKFTIKVPPMSEELVLFQPSSRDNLVIDFAYNVYSIEMDIMDLLKNDNPHIQYRSNGEKVPIYMHTIQRNDSSYIVINNQSSDLLMKGILKLALTNLQDHNNHQANIYSFTVEPNSHFAIQLDKINPFEEDRYIVDESKYTITPINEIKSTPIDVTAKDDNNKSNHEQ